MSKLEGLIDDVLLMLQRQLDSRFASTGETFDLGDWCQYFAFEVMGTMTFSKGYGFIEEGRDVGGMLNAIQSFMKTVAPVGNQANPPKKARANLIVFVDDADVLAGQDIIQEPHRRFY